MRYHSWDYPYQPPRKDWTAERAIAQTRARISLQCAHHDPVKGGKIWKVRYRRFCFGDYRRVQLSIYENAASLTFRLTKDKLEQWRYLLSFKHGRLAFYRARKNGELTSIRRVIPMNGEFSLTEPIRHSYPVAFARFNRRLIKLVRAKARANGIRMPVTDHTSLAEYLMDYLYPARRDFAAQLTTAGLDFVRVEGRLKQRHVLSALRGPTADVVRRATGYQSKAVAKLFWGRLADNEWPSRVGWATLLRTYLPVDYTQQLLAANAVAGFDAQTWSKRAAVTRLLKTFTPKRLMGILQETNNGTFIRDAGVDYNVLWEAGYRLPVPHDFKTIEDLHDHLARERRKLNERDFALKAKWAEKVDGREVEGYRIVCPTSAHQMGDWGSQMSNCIGGYASAVNSGHTRILGLIQEDRCHWGIEIQRGEIVQFRGRFNADAPAHLRAAVEAVLQEAGLIHFACIGKVVRQVGDGMVEIELNAARQEEPDLMPLCA